MIVLDTHAWVWWHAKPDKLSSRARRSIDDAEKVGVSAISCWELSMLIAKGRIKLDRDLLEWIDEALPEGVFSLLPISPPVAVMAGSLGNGFHGDPADRLIVATAIQAKVPLVTSDGRIHSFQGVDVIW